MVSVQRTLFLLGFAALGAGIVLIGGGAIFARPEADVLGTFFYLPAMMFIVYGISCVVGGLILIFLFREKKKQR